MNRWSLVATATVVIGALVIGSVLLASEPATIYVGGLFDLSGPTSDVSSNYAAGIEACTRYINDHGGIEGAPVELLAFDYGYDLSRAEKIYERLRARGDVFAIQGWGTHDTCALRQRVNKDKVVFFSASYSPTLADSRAAPYNFFTGASYDTQIKLAMKFAKSRGGRKVVFVYPDTPYGTAPIEAGKAYARELGMEVGPDQIVKLDQMCTENAMEKVQKFGADFVWLGGTRKSTAAILSDAAKLEMRASFIVNCWGFDEGLPERIPATIHPQVYGMTPAVPFGADVPGMQPLLEYAKPGDHTLHFVKGWISMRVLAEGLRRAKAAGNLSGEGVKHALETLDNFSTGYLAAPITYTGENHNPNHACSIGAIRDRRLVVLTSHRLGD